MKENSIIRYFLVEDKKTDLMSEIVVRSPNIMYLRNAGPS